MEGVKMKRLKCKRISILVAFILLFSFSAYLYAEGITTNAVFTVGSANAGSGDTDVVIPISVVDCPYFTGIGLQLDYDASMLILTDISLAEGIAGFLEPNVNAGIIQFDWNEAAFPDGEIFMLNFSVSEYAMSGTYPINLALSSAGWASSEGEMGTEIFASEDNFVVGKINVTGQNVAEVDDKMYETLGEALAATIGAEQPATITMLANTMIEDVSDRIVIPNGSEITLDMNGYTIASALAGCSVDHQNKPVGDSVESATVEVQTEGKLNIVDNSTNGGGAFTHTTGNRYTRFLINSGTLNIDNIIVSNFYDGVRDGSFYAGKGSGTYGVMSNCEFTASTIGGISNNNKVALNFGAGAVDTVEDCIINGYDVKNANSIVVGTYNDKGSLNLLKNCTIYGGVLISRYGTVDTVQNNTIINAPEDDDFARAMKIDGSVGTIDGGYIEGVYDAVNVGSSGKIDLILDGEFKAWDQAIYNYGTVGEVRGGNFHVGYYNAYTNVGNTNLISGGTFKSDQYRALYNEGGYIGEISGGDFFAGSAYYGVDNVGTIDTVSGGLFYSESYSPFVNGSAYSYQRAIINTISGGIFINNANSSTLSCLNNSTYGSTIGEISGGTFISKNQSAINISGEDSVVENISGGTFIGKVAGLRVKNNSIESVSGGVFFGEGVAIYVDGETNSHEAHIEDISGGYFKTLGENGLIVALGDSSWTSDAGYNFSTVPLREQDLPENFPDEEIIENQNRTGFYHFGKTVDITWEIEGEEDVIDLFVKGDPIYYPYDEPRKESENDIKYNFKGWSDGENTYPDGQSLAIAEDDITYTAVFETRGPEEDYTVSLVTEADNKNPSDDINVDVIITSEHNEDFYGATVEVTYDNTQVEYKDSSVLASNFGVTSSTEGTITTLKLTGAKVDGYAITGDGFKLATLKFEVKRGITNGETTFSIKDGPVVDQQGAVQSILVEKGENVTLKLWNITVTFKAGDNVTMVPNEAKAYVRYNNVGLWTDDSYHLEFTEPILTASEHYTLDTPAWKPETGGNVDFANIKAKAFTANAEYTATAFANSCDVDLPDSVEVFTGVEDGKATYGTDVVFTVNVEKTPLGYQLDKVSYTVGEGTAGILTADGAGKYTISGDEITGNIKVFVNYIVGGEVEFIEFDDFNSLPTGFKLLKLTVDNKLNDSAYKYNGNAMFYSSKYSKNDKHVYLYVVSGSIGEVDALTDIKIVAGDTCIELAYDGDVIRDGELNSTDAVLTYALYNSELHADDSEFLKVSMQMRLEADVNGDEKVDSSDAQAILNKIWGVE